MQARVLLGIALFVVAFTLLGRPEQGVADDGNVEERIAKFWDRINAMQPSDYLSSADLGQWALNVIERDSRARLTVADFRAATAAMQAAIERAGPAPTVAQRTATPAPTPPPIVATPAPTVTAPPPTPAPAGGGLTLEAIDGRAILVATDGTYLGIVSSNRYASESICNEYGSYGSPYASKSIRNEYGQYGSPYSSKSAYNPYASTPPAIVYEGQVVGYLTKNQYKAGAVDPDILFAVYGCSY